MRMRWNSLPTHFAAKTSNVAKFLCSRGAPTDKVVYFHPVFSNGSTDSPRTWNIVVATYPDVFDFVAQCVVPDMKEWALEEDAGDL